MGYEYRALLLSGTDYTNGMGGAGRDGKSGKMAVGRPVVPDQRLCWRHAGVKGPDSLKRKIRFSEKNL